MANDDVTVAQNIVGMSRRKAIKVGAGAGGAALLRFHPLYLNAYPVPVAVWFIGGLVLGEVVLGVLRAYDVDIGETVEDVVRHFRTKDYPQGISTRSTQKPRAISRVGQTETGFVQVNEKGVLAAESRKRPAYPSEPAGFWVPGSLFWVATGEGIEMADLGDLDKCRCGYPVGMFKYERKTSYTIYRQQFQGGIAEVEIDRKALPKEDEVIVTDVREQRVMREWQWKYG